MINKKKKLDGSVEKAAVSSLFKRNRVVFKYVSDAERQRLRIGCIRDVVRERNRSRQTLLLIGIGSKE